MNKRYAVPTFLVFLAAFCFSYFGCDKTGDDECDPEGFGRQCADDGKGYVKCGGTSCEDSYGLPCDEHSVIEEFDCPSHRPTCETKSGEGEPEVVCVGEDIGGCDELGFIECKDENTVIECIADGDGELFKSRGGCGDGEKCYEPFEFHAGGCTSLVPQ